MGSLSLLCPMCCGETFNNPESLKYHLLSVTDNLYCPACSTKTYSMAALIQHLDSCGKDSNSSGTVQKLENDQDLPEDELNDKDDMMEDDDMSEGSFMATVNEDGIMVVGEGRTIQVDENGDIRVLDRGRSMNKAEAFTFASVQDIDDAVSSVADTSELMNEDESTMVSITQAESMGSMDDVNYEMKLESHQTFGNEQVEGVSLYSCSTCDVSFESVLDHIKQYHDGQEVVLEMGDQQLKELESESENVPTATKESRAVSDSPSRLNKQTSVKSKKSMNTIRTEECIDNEGRMYTRKVVQIERFWDRAPGNVSETKAPMIEKFFSNVEGVKVRDKILTVAPTQMYRCTQCLEQFAKLNDFQIHFCFQKNNRCDQCDQTFASSKLLQAHLKEHENSDLPLQKIFLCTVCGTEFLTHKSLRLHSRMHAPVKSRHVDAPEGTEEETFVCVECGTTLSESYRAAHMALHAGDPITCHICNRKFDSAESLAMHAAVHTEAANPQIINSSNIVDQSITISSTDADGHTTLLSSDAINEGAAPQGTVTNLDGQTNAEPVGIELLKPYQCQHCGRRFTRPHEKVKHERIHTGEKPHSCEVCGKKFRVSYCLTLHMRTHTGVRPYECQHCGKRFKASSVYNHHLLTHGEERAYTCPYCPKTFKTRVQLAGHKNSHTKPFRCTECSRPFASLYAARAHMQTHKKDNNLKFSCTICGASYGRAFALKDHVKQHEQENSLMPPEPAREEEVHELDTFLLQGDEGVELIVPSPPPPPPCDNELEDM